MLVELRGGPLGSSRHTLLEIPGGSTTYKVALFTAEWVPDGTPTDQLPIETITYEPTGFVTNSVLGEAQVWALPYSEWVRYEDWKRRRRTLHG